MQFSDEIMRKARRLLEQGQIKQDEEQPAVWWVTSLRKSATTYRVQTDWGSEGGLSWMTCTCPHGLNTGFGSAKCYHVAAVLLKLRHREIAEIVRDPHTEKETE